MKHAIRLWMGGRDYFKLGEPCSAWNGVLTFMGVPVGFCYYSYVTARRHQIMSVDCDVKVMRHFKNREVYHHSDIMALIRVLTDNSWSTHPPLHDDIIIRRVNASNAMCEAVGAPHAYRSGSEYLPDNRNTGDPWASTAPSSEQNELSCVLYRLHKDCSKPFPYLVKVQCDTDKATLRDTPGWRDLGRDWWGTQDLTNFTLFKIGRVKSLAVEVPG